MRTRRISTDSRTHGFRVFLKMALETMSPREPGFNPGCGSCPPVGDNLGALVEGAAHHKAAGRCRNGLKPTPGAPPKVVLLLPPCIPVGRKAAVQVHLEWGTECLGGDGKVELLGAAHGAQVFSKKISREDGNFVRVEWFPAELGVVDVFVLGTSPAGEVSVGELGHLLVLPPSVCKEANGIFEKMVVNSGSDSSNGSDNMSIQLERAIVVLLQNWDTAAQQGLQSSCGPETRLRSFPGLRRVDEYVRGISSQTNPERASKAGTRNIVVNLDGSKESISLANSLDNRQKKLRVQKFVWRSQFKALVLDNDVLFQLLATRRKRMLQPRAGHGHNHPADLDIAIKLIMGNILRFLRKYEAWNFIAHVLHRCAEYEVEICWGEKELRKDALTGLRLQEMAKSGN